MTYNTSTESGWELKSNETLRISDILCLRAHRKLDGLTGFKALFWMDIFKAVAFEMGDVMEDSDGNQPQRIGRVLNAWTTKLTYHVFSLWIKPTGLHNLFLDEEDVGLVSTEYFGQGVMLPGYEIFAIGTGWSCDFQFLLFLFTQMQKETPLIACSAPSW